MQRRRDTGVVEDLLDEPHRYRFFQTVRLMELWFARQQPADNHRERVARHLRFLNSPSLAFPASEVAGAVAYDKEGKPLTDPDDLRAALEAGTLDRVDLTPAFFGLLGGQGSLPLHYSETLARHEAMRRDPGARAFFDIFSNRATALFYAAWKKYRLPLRHETEPDRHYMPLLLALAGVGHPALRHRLQTGGGKVFDESLAHYAATTRQRPVSATYLQQVLADYFGVALRVEQFVGRWYRVPREHLASLDGQGMALGVSAHLGERIWQCDLRMRIWIGPVRKAVFRDFLPGGERAQALEKLLVMFGGLGFEYEVRLILAREDIGPSTLDEGGDVRLGWNAFLCTQEVAEDRDDASYELHTIH